MTNPAFTQSFPSFACYYDTIAIEAEGFTITASVEPDEDHGDPWDNEDGHGPVSDWTSRDKLPGELILCRDWSSRRYYDIASATRIAKADSWGLAGGRLAGETEGAYAYRAARADFEALRAYCEGDWSYVGIKVTVSREGLELGAASLWGIDCNHPHGDNSSLTEAANELIDEAMEEARAKLSKLCGCIPA